MLDQIKKLLLGNGLAQALQFASLVILSRIYMPTDFGFLAQVQSAATLLAIGATLQLHLTISLSRSAEDARAAVKHVESVCLILLAVAAVPALALGAHFPFAVVLAAFLGLSNTYNGYLVFSGSFGQLSAFYVARAMAIIACQILLAVAEVPDGLVWAALAGEACAAGYLRAARVKLWTWPGLDLGKAWQFVKSHPSFSLFGTLQELASASAFYAPLILFAHVHGQAVAGQYAMANRLVWAPVVLVSGSLAQVLHHRFGRQPPSRMSEVFPPKRLWTTLPALAAIGALSFLLQGPVNWALGPAWGMASEMIPFMVLSGCAFMVSIPFRIACRVLHLQKWQLMQDLAVLLAVSALLSNPALSPVAGMKGLALLSCAQTLVLCVIVRFGAQSPQPTHSK